MTDRPSRLIVVAGTATEIGKTWVAARLLEELRRRGATVAARKPAQSFEPGGTATDAEVLAAASGEEAAAVCPPHRSYEVAMAPFMAAEVLERPTFTAHDLIIELSWPPHVDVGIVESVGGVRSPISSDGADTVDMARLLGSVLVVLVADAGLGTINAVRLAVDALHGFDVVVFLNRFDDGNELHRRNRDWLANRLHAAVFTDVGPLTDAVRGTNSRQ